MALRYIDSMGDHYTAAQVTTKWTTAYNPIRRAGLHGYGMSGNLKKGMLFGSTTILMEAYIYRQDDAGETCFRVFDTDQVLQILCDMNSDGSIKVQRYGSNAVLDFIAQTAPDLVRQAVWYHLGWRVFLHPSAGSVEVRLNGGVVVNVSGVKTTSTNLPWAGAIGAFGLGANSSSITFDDLVVMDDVEDGLSDARLPGGGGFDKFLGPVEIKVKRPNAVGLSAEWTPTPAVPNWQNVDDTESDDDATYNGAVAAAVGASDLFGMEDLAADEDVIAVQSLVLARKTEEGTAAAATLVRDAGATTVGPTIYQPSIYAYMIRAEPTRPGGALWSKVAWDAIQYGYRRIV